MMLKAFRVLPAILLLSALAPSGAADEVADVTNLSIEQLLQVEVIGASRLGQSNQRAPTSISTLTAADIRSFGWRTLLEALNGIRGLYASNDRNYSHLGTRGFLRPADYNSRVLIMIDGQRMNETLFDGGYLAQEFMLDVDLIERIEYIPGPGASIYGANAFLGLINVITKKGKSIDGAQLAGEYGTFNSYKGRASYGKQFDNGVDLLFSASHYSSDGPDRLYFPEFDAPATNNGIARNVDSEQAERLFTSIKYRDFTLSGGYVDRHKQVPTAAYEGIFNDPGYFTDDRQFFGNLAYQSEVARQTSLRLKAFYQGYDYRADEPYQSVDVARGINRDLGSGRWWGGEAQLTSEAIEGHRLMFGLEYQFDQRQQLQNYNLDPLFWYTRSNRQGHRVEVYAQDDIRFLENWTFSGGLRLDYHHMLNALQLNPRLGLIWNARDNLDLKLLYSSSFRAPNAFERDYNYGINYVANPYNFEERIKSYEALIEWRPAGDFKLTGDLFYYQITQLLQQAPDPGDPAYGDVGQFRNRGRYHAFGFELEAERRWHNGRLLKASYSYSRLTDDVIGGWSIASPYNLFKLHYAEPLFDDLLRLGLENVFVDQRRAQQGGMADAYYQFNLNLSSDRLLKHSLVSLGVYNLFDTHYPMVGGSGPADIAQNILPMDGRQFRVKLQLTF